MDIASCFTAIPHEKLMQAMEERVAGQPVYLHRLDREWEQAETALPRLRQLLAGLGLEPKEAKTRRQGDAACPRPDP